MRHVRLCSPEKLVGWEEMLAQDQKELGRYRHLLPLLSDPFDRQVCQSRITLYERFVAEKIEMVAHFRDEARLVATRRKIDAMARGNA